MHLAQYVCLVGLPFSITVTRCKLGWKGRLVCRFECETACPNVTALPQLLHFAIGETSFILTIYVAVHAAYRSSQIARLAICDMRSAIGSAFSENGADVTILQESSL